MTAYTTPLAAYPNRAIRSTQGLAHRAASSAYSPASLPASRAEESPPAMYVTSYTLIQDTFVYIIF